MSGDTTHPRDPIVYSRDQLLALWAKRCGLTRHSSVEEEETGVLGWEVVPQKEETI